MTRSSLNNASELRQISNPIPINAWQMRNSSQLDDSTQFDPGIMEQCISQSSVSPSSAASYTLSPTIIAFNSNANRNNLTFLNQQQQQQQQQQHQQQIQLQQQQFNNAQNININNLSEQDFYSTDLMNTYNLLNTSEETTVNGCVQTVPSSSSTTTTTSTGNIDLSSSIDLESMLVNTTISDTANIQQLISGHHQDSNFIFNNNNNNNHNQQQILNPSQNHLHSHHQIHANYSHSQNDEFNNEEQLHTINMNPFLLRNSHNNITNDSLIGSIQPSNTPIANNNTNMIGQASRNGSANNNNTNNLVRIDLNNNDKAVAAAHSLASANLANIQTQRPQTVANAASFLLNRKYPNIQQQQQQQQQQQSMNNNNLINKHQKQKQKRINQIKIEEEEETQQPNTTPNTIRNILLKNHQQQQQQHIMQQQSQQIQIQPHNHQQQQQQHHVLPMSLPTQSYLYARFNDVHSGHVTNSHHHQQQQQHVHHQSSEILSNRDPVLTQIILPQQQQQQLNLNQQMHENQASAYNFDTTHKINPSQFINSEFIQPQQQQQQQQQSQTTEQYFIISNVNSNQNNMGQMYQNNFSMSLPSNYNSYLMNSKKLHNQQQTDSTHFQAHQASANSSTCVKKEFLDNSLNHEASSPSSQSIAASTATNIMDDYDTDKFSKMKLSSPLSIANSQVVSPPGLDAVMTLFDLESLDATGQNQTTSANATTANNMNTLNSLVGDSNTLMLENYDQLLPIHNSLMNEFENDEKPRLDDYEEGEEEEDDDEDFDDEDEDDEEDDDDDDDDEDDDDDDDEEEDDQDDDGDDLDNQTFDKLVYAGSVGSSFYKPLNSSNARKHARTHELSSDVHSLSNKKKQNKSVNIKNITPFNFESSQVALNSSSFHLHDTNTNLLSTSLPATNKFDQLFKKQHANHAQQQLQHHHHQQQQQQQHQQHVVYQFGQATPHGNHMHMSHTTHFAPTQQQSPAHASSFQDNHPNLNKLLQTQQQSSSPTTLSLLKSGTSKRQRNSNSLSKQTRKSSEQSKQENSRKQQQQQQKGKKSSPLATASSSSSKTAARAIRRKDSDADQEELNEDLDTQDLFDDYGMMDDESDDDSNESNVMSSRTGRSSMKKSGSAASSLINSDSLFDLMMSSKNNRDVFFWQYNIQSKGPKTKKVLTLRNKDPHLHREFFDPVFQLQSLNARQGQSLNKLRKGDGNDVTPNIDKLYNLGLQIKDFIQKSYQMNCFTNSSSNINSLCANNTQSSSSLNQLSASLNSRPVELTSNKPPKLNLKREKNKIASRACRLKKKAQHEANKIKLSGLNEEHKQLIDCINETRTLIKTRLKEPHKLPPNKKMVELADELSNRVLQTKVAGNADGFVQNLLISVEKERAKNHKAGGLYDLSNQSQLNILSNAGMNSNNNDFTMEDLQFNTSLSPEYSNNF